MRTILKKLLFKFNLFLNSLFKRESCYILCKGNIDGVGAQIHALFSVMLFSKMYKIHFLYSPFTQVEHMLGREKEFDMFNSLINPYCTDINNINFANQIHFINIENPLLFIVKRNKMFVARNCHQSTDLIVDEYLKLGVIKNLRDNFKKNKIAGQFNLKIHVRRGDVDEFGDNSSRFTSLKTIKQLLHLITDLLKKNNIVFNVLLFSQGNISDFNILSDFPIVYHLNKSEIFTFEELCCSDILVTAKSSFSYSAALLNDGIVFYDQFWHPPLSHWINFCKESEESIVKKINFNLNQIKNV